MCCHYGHVWTRDELGTKVPYPHDWPLLLRQGHDDIMLPALPPPSLPIFWGSRRAVRLVSSNLQAPNDCQHPL